jgi:NAD(P)-dependent dehydrogenase (short-subunit alcohol dehydrogenase family)
MEIKDKVIVITGHTSGIGKALYERLAAYNTVIGLSRSAIDNGKTQFKCDVSDSKRVKEIFSEINKLYGRVDILFNNAGYGISGATEDISSEEAEKVVKVNFLGQLYAAQAALPLMNAGARIINISSVSGISPMPFRALYNSTKAAVNMLSSSLRMELKPLGIGVTALCLGDTETDFSAHRIISSDSDRYSKRTEEIDSFLIRRGNKGKMKLDKAVNCIIIIASKDKIKERYIIGIKYRIFSHVYKFFPRFISYLTLKVFSKKR